MPASVYVVPGVGVGLFLEFWYVFRVVLSPGETFTPEGLVKVLNMALFILFVGATVAMFATRGFYDLPEDSLELTAVVALLEVYVTVECIVMGKGSSSGCHGQVGCYVDAWFFCEDVYGSVGIYTAT